MKCSAWSSLEKVDIPWIQGLECNGVKPEVRSEKLEASAVNYQLFLTLLHILYRNIASRYAMRDDTGFRSQQY